MPYRLRDTTANHYHGLSRISQCSVRKLKKKRNLKSEKCITIRKTCPCNVNPLEPHFFIAKQGYGGVYLFFLFLLQNIDCGYSLEPPRRGGSNVYPQSMFWTKVRKISKFFYWKFPNFYNLKKSLYIAWASFRNGNVLLKFHGRLRFEQTGLPWLPGT